MFGSTICWSLQSHCNKSLFSAVAEFIECSNTCFIYSQTFYFINIPAYFPFLHISPHYNLCRGNVNGIPENKTKECLLECMNCSSIYWQYFIIGYFYFLELSNGTRFVCVSKGKRFSMRRFFHVWSIWLGMYDVCTNFVDYSFHLTWNSWWSMIL